MKVKKGTDYDGFAQFPILERDFAYPWDRQCFRAGIYYLLALEEYLANL